jgi:hypothetical protein
LVLYFSELPIISYDFSKVFHKDDSPSPRWLAHSAKAPTWASTAGAQCGHARRIGRRCAVSLDNHPAAASSWVRGSPPCQHTPALNCPLGAAFWNPEARRETVRRRNISPCNKSMTRWPAHRSNARRRRAQGHELPRSYDPSRVATRAARLASGLVQSARRHARATAVHAHTRPCHAHSARPCGSQRCSTRRSGGAQTSPAK